MPKADHKAALERAYTVLLSHPNIPVKIGYEKDFHALIRIYKKNPNESVSRGQNISKIDHFRWHLAKQVLIRC